GPASSAIGVVARPRSARLHQRLSVPEALGRARACINGGPRDGPPNPPNARKRPGEAGALLGRLALGSGHGGGLALGSVATAPGARKRRGRVWRSEAARQRLALGSAAAESGVRRRRGRVWRSEAPRQSLAFGGAAAALGARKRRGRVWRSGAPRQRLALGSAAAESGARRRRGRVWRSEAPRQPLALGSAAAESGVRRRAASLAGHAAD